ncbi:MAG TPA: Glu/Leu/Phe/Val dehydrogenase dimerization domain-containing protein [Bacteroidia bacterium]|jgi:leucine dehydrogenase|nr:Glu/Leu/Phe/Val dehydrogenase dimerization domain-containing protein [Bacteroidia bacterium]
MLTANDTKTVTNPAGPLGQMSVFDHEQVVFCNDNTTGLKAIIAIHNTTLGPALGGTRMWPYVNESEALTDVLRLSRGMTYKAAVAGLNLGGGKAVIIADSRKDKNEGLMRRFGKFVDSLGGKYITAEDVGVNAKDMEQVHMETKHVTGIPPALGGSGDPSPVTAYGVYMGMKASAKERWGNDSLSGKKIAVQGIGNVGSHLVDHLVKEGATIFITDIYEDKVSAVKKKHASVEVVSGDKLFDLDIDIYAPCALGATVNNESLAKLKCSIICGAANNQLADENVHGKIVMEKGILYAPDFVVNAGGLINVYSEVAGYGSEYAMLQAQNIYSTTAAIFAMSKKENIPTFLAANRTAEARIAAIAHIKTKR